MGGRSISPRRGRSRSHFHAFRLGFPRSSTMEAPVRQTPDSLLAALARRIQSKDAVIGVIGLGYVGVSVASALAGAGFRVLGVDLKADRVAKINAGECPIEGIEPGLPELIAGVATSKRLVATTDYAPLAE